MTFVTFFIRSYFWVNKEFVLVLLDPFNKEPREPIKSNSHICRITIIEIIIPFPHHLSITPFQLRPRRKAIKNKKTTVEDDLLMLSDFIFNSFLKFYIYEERYL